MADVGASVALGDERLDDLTHQLLARIAEQPLGLHVDERDSTALVDYHHRVGGGVDQLPKGFGFTEHRRARGGRRHEARRAGRLLNGSWQSKSRMTLTQPLAESDVRA